MLDRKYLAGLFDGRGQLYVLKNKNLRVGFRMSSGLPEMLKREFGGTCFKHDDKMWFRVDGERARFLLMEILPHIRATKKRVKKLLKMSRRKKRREIPRPR